MNSSFAVLIFLAAVLFWWDRTQKRKKAAVHDFWLALGRKAESYREEGKDMDADRLDRMRFSLGRARMALSDSHYSADDLRAIKGDVVLLTGEDYIAGEAGIPFGSPRYADVYSENMRFASHLEKLQRRRGRQV